MPCIGIPVLFVREETINSNEKHSCGCEACIKNIEELRKNNVLSKSKVKHTCNCKACKENQDKIKQWRRKHEKIQMPKPRL